MPYIHPAAREHELKRWMRADAHRFLRPDWRRFVEPGSELWTLYESIECKYSPDQPRVPRGQPEGGQWTSDGDGEANVSADSNGGTEELSAASKKRGDGHHYVPRAVVKNKGISDEAAVVFEKAKTGPLFDTRSNRWDEEHRIYSKAVDEALDDYLKQKSTGPQQMSAEQAREFLGKKIFESQDPRIKGYNMGIQMRELMMRLFRRGGRE